MPTDTEFLRQRAFLLAFGAVACAVVACLLLVWLMVTLFAAGLFVLVLSYALGLAAAVLQVRSLVTLQKLPDPKPFVPMLSLVVVIPVLGCQLWAVLLIFTHGSFR